MKRALVCVDHSAQSNFVFVQAKEFAERYRAELVLLQVVVPAHGLTLPGAPVPPALEQSVNDAKRELRELMDQVPEAFRGPVVVGVGEPWRVICYQGSELNADFILLGSHGVHGLENVFGTTASHVVQKADRSVIVLRPRPRS
jgi:nucleotide-binding universal stress UspA family protein